MTTETRDEIRNHLFRKLAATAESIRQGGAMTDHETATAFLTVGVVVAQHASGPVGAAEWLRDLADEIERGETSLNGPMQ